MDKSGPDPATLILRIGAGEYIFRQLTLADLDSLRPLLASFITILLSRPFLSAVEYLTEGLSEEKILKQINPLLAESPDDRTAFGLQHVSRLLDFWRDHLSELQLPEKERVN